MSAYLLDSHVFAWATDQPDRLSRPARRTLSDPSNTLVVSAASAWEIGTKYRLGKWPEAERLATQFSETVDALGATSLSISVRHATRAALLDWDHADPFDRMLAAQAMVDNLVFVTRDGAFDAVRGLKTLW